MRRFLPYAIFLSAVLYFSWFVNRGMTLYDEGYILEANYLVYLGKVPFRDFFFQYPPLIVWLGAFWFKLFGPGIINLRWLGLIFAAITVVVAYLIGRKLENRLWGLILAIAFLAWGFPQTNFLWPSSLSLLFNILAFYLILLFAEKGKAGYLFLGGSAVGLSLLSRQNMGLAALFAGVFWTFSLWLSRNKKFRLLTFYIGLALPLGIAAGALLSQDALGLALQNIYSLSVKAATQGIVSSVYPLVPSLSFSLAGFAKFFVKFLIYAFPLILFVISAFSLLRGKKTNPFWFGAVCFSVFHFLLTIWPTSDLVHASFALPMVFILLASYPKIGPRGLKIALFITLLTFSIIGFYKSWYLPYYTFETPYRGQTKQVELRGEKVYVDDKYYEIISKTLRIKKDLIKDELFFVYPFAPALYFFTDSVPPTYYLHTTPGFLSEEEQKRVIKNLEDKKVDWVLIEEWRDTAGGSILSDYLDKNFREVDRIWDIIVRKRT